MTEADVNVLVERLYNLINKQATDEENAERWRMKFCEKLDSLRSRLEKLPCERSEEEKVSIRKDIGWLQKILYSVAGFVCAVVVPALVSLAVVWGSVNTTVLHHESNISKLQTDFHQHEVKDDKRLAVVNGERSRV